jgi:hypothetical protein
MIAGLNQRDEVIPRRATRRQPSQSQLCSIQRLCGVEPAFGNADVFGVQIIEDVCIGAIDSSERFEFV